MLALADTARTSIYLLTEERLDFSASSGIEIFEENIMRLEKKCLISLTTCTSDLLVVSFTSHYIRQSRVVQRV